MTEKLRCPYHGGNVIRLSWETYYCIPDKNFYTGTTGHEFTI